MNETGTILEIGVVAADINHADAIVRIQHGDGIPRADFQPLFQIAAGMVEYAMQHQGRQRESSDTIHLAGNLDLAEIMRVNFDKHLYPQRCRLPREIRR